MSDEQRLEDLRQILKTRTAVTDSEFSSDELDQYLEYALTRTTENYTLTEISQFSRLENLLLLNAMVSIAQSRAARASLSYRLRSEKGESYKNQIVENNLNLVSVLEKEIDKVEDLVGIGPNSVQHSYLIRTNSAGQYIPFSLIDEPMASTLSVSMSSNYPLFTWTDKEMGDFAYYELWRNDSETIEAEYNNSGVVEEAKLIHREPEKQRRTYYYDNCPSGTYFFTLATVNRNGLKSFSNVVEATI